MSGGLPPPQPTLMCRFENVTRLNGNYVASAGALSLLPWHLPGRGRNDVIFFRTYGIIFPYVRNYFSVHTELFFRTHGIVFPYIRNYFSVRTELFYGIFFPYIRNFFSVHTELFFRTYGIVFSYVQNYADSKNVTRFNGRYVTSARALSLSP